jgi:protein TonB
MKINKPNGVRSHGNENQSHISKKHATNLRKNGILRFQIGLLLSLIVVYALLEANFLVLDKHIDAYAPIEEDLITVAIPNFEIEQEPKLKQKTLQKTTVALTKDPKIVDDDHKILKGMEFKNEPAPIDDFDPNAVPVIDEPDNETPVPFEKVEFVPIFPGCESLATNEERKECMSSKINKIIQRNFKASIGERYGLSGLQRINVQFSIDKNGNIANVKVRAPHPALEKEARRVINLLPEMQPGMQRDNPVEVIFLKPILFRIE